ncbi:MAG: hypothetical protein R8M45_03900 [Ghiorsea sp.]
MAIITYKLRTENARNFIDSTNSASGNYYYLTYGRNTAWANELVPPTPVDTGSTQASVWSDMLGIQRIESPDVSLVVPRKDWAQGSMFVPFDINAPTRYLSEFYCMNSNMQVFTVETNAGNSLTSNEPLFSGISNIIDTLDGYTWRYLYTLSIPQIDKFYTANWMPVNYSESLDATQIGANHKGDALASIRLGAVSLMMYDNLRDIDFSLVEIPTYRQLSIIRNLKDASNVNNFVGTHAIPTDTAVITPSTGDIIYIDNRTQIQRVANQREESRIILDF